MKIIMIIKMNPLDLIFFKGTDLISKTVLLAQAINSGNSSFSHVGIVVNKELLNLDLMEPDILYILESTVADGKVLDINEKRVIGVQIRPLEEVVNSYKSEPDCYVAYAKLKNNPFLTNKDHTISVFRKVYKNYANSFYNMNILHLLSAVFPCLRKPRQFFDKIVHIGYTTITNNNYFNRSQWVFCSELVAIIYLELKIISDVNPETVIPTDFLGTDVDGLELALSDIIYI